MQDSIVISEKLLLSRSEILKRQFNNLIFSLKMANIGKITQIIGPVVDVSFEAQDMELPNILEALEIDRPDGVIVLECQQHIGEDTIRAIAMDSTDGLSRGMTVRSTGAAIRMPVGDNIKGRLFNVVGDAIDGIGKVSKEGGRPIHNSPPKFEELSTESEVLFTG